MSKSATNSSAKALSRLLAEERVLAFLPKVLAALPTSEWYLVGGAVRDHVLGRTTRKDYDFVVRKVSLEVLEPALAKLGHVDLVGRDFGVLRFMPEGCEGEEPVDIAWPRTEQAGGSGGYRDFAVQADPELPLERDLARRDFTMNAVAFDVRNAAFIDPFNGLADIAATTVRAVGDAQERFGEDLSRILRGIRLACELGFEIENATGKAMVALAPRLNDVRGADGVAAAKAPAEDYIVPRETIARNFVRALAANPTRAVDLMESSGILFLLIPELALLSATKQSPNHHSEGDVWTHTKLALKNLRNPEFAAFFPGEQADAETVLATLFHDIAKPQTAKEIDGRIRFFGHDLLGADMMRVVARRLRLSSVPDHAIDEERLAWLVHMHLFPTTANLEVVKKTTLVKHFLSDRARGRRLLHLCFADVSAALRPDGSTDTTTLRKLMSALADLETQDTVEEGKVKTLLTGEEVMAELHLDPGPEVGRILEALQEAQLEGKVRTVEQAKRFLSENEKEA